MKISVKAISEATGFSTATVSNALNHKKGVNKDTSATIFRVAKELGYVEDVQIKRIKFVIFKADGSIIDDTPFFSLMIDGVEKECRNCGLDLMICNLDKRSLDFEEQVQELIHNPSCAVILLGTELAEEDLLPFKEADCPFLILDYWSSDMSFNGILINNSDSARMAVEYLIKKGHREIGYLNGSFRIKAFRSRSVGYQVALEKAGIEYNPAFNVTLSTTMDGAYRNMKDYLAKDPKLPTAYFADNDMIALGAMKAMTECGIKIPQDVSIIGFDDLPFCEISYPRLTTIRVSKQEMGQLAVKRMTEIMKNADGSNLKIQVCTQFVERDSVRER